MNVNNELLPALQSDKIDYTLLIAKRHKIVWNVENQQKVLLSEPNPKWIKPHPYIKTKNEQGQTIPLAYLPIDKVEFLLKLLFNRYRIEITDQGTSFNGVFVSVRVHYFDPVFNEWSYQDGIGAMQLQTASGKSPADLANINNGALAMAYPSAKSYAIKDACDHIGNIFGANLNRNHTLSTEHILKAEKFVNNPTFVKDDKVNGVMNNLENVLKNRK